MKPGRADEFIARWEEITAWAVQHAPGCLWGVLLRDSEDPDLFVHTGAWECSEDVRAWISNPERLKWIEAINELVDHYEPRTMHLAAVRDPEEWSGASLAASTPPIPPDPPSER